MLCPHDGSAMRFRRWTLAAAGLGGSLLLVERGTPARASSEVQAGAGGIVGLVRLAGDVRPGPTSVRNTTDPRVCGYRQSLEDWVVSAETGGVRWAIAVLTGVPENMVTPRRPRRLVLDNRDCRFSPHAAVLTVGDTIVAANSDPLLHTVHFYGPLEANVALPFQGLRVERTVERPGLIIVKCDVHGWMQAFVRVDPHPYHAVTDRDGRFRIEGIPPGEYELEIWHEKVGATRRSVVVRSGEETPVEVELAPR